MSRCAVWLAWHEVARTDAGMAVVADGVDGWEGWLLNEVFDHRLDEADVDLMVAAIRGLTVRRVVRSEGIDADRLLLLIQWLGETV